MTRSTIRVGVLLAAGGFVVLASFFGSRTQQVRAVPDYQALRDDANGALVYVFADGSGQVLPYTPQPVITSAPSAPTLTAPPSAVPATATAAPSATAGATATSAPTAAPQPVLLNGSFEQDGGWVAYFTQTSTAGKEPSVLRAVKGEGPFAGMVYDGARSLHLRGEYLCFQGGVYQRLAATPGQALRLTAWFQTWSNTTDLFELPSDINTYQSVRLGIDPKGGTDPLSSRVEWTERGAGGDWQQLVVDTYAGAPAVTIFVGANVGYHYPDQCNWPLRNNWALFDLVELTAP